MSGGIEIIGAPSRGSSKSQHFGWGRMMVCLVWMGASPLLAQTNFYTIYANGPTSNRVNVVLLAEGYRVSEYGLFRTNATNVANAFLATEPFSAYRKYLNFFAIAVPSVQSGSDHPSYPSYRDTYFSSTYSDSDQLITIPSGATGQGRVNALLSTYLPQTHLAVMLVNDNALGGSDNGGTLAISSVSPNSLSYVPLHEAGHVLANLGDEYATVNAGYPELEEPNTTRATNRTSIKWNAWISPETPVPTPATFEFESQVGLFEGAHYHSSGWFRPRLNCMMKSAGYAFCEICRETLVRALYQRVRPVETVSPIANNLTTTSNQSIQFVLNLLQPEQHALSIQWLANGVPVSGATNDAFSILPSLLTAGTNTVSGIITDPTPWVRSDPSRLLVQTQTWTVVVSLPRLQLSNPRWLAGQRFAFQISGVAPQGFVVQASENFQSWTNLATNMLGNGSSYYTNQFEDFPMRYFRAMALP